MFDVHVLFPTPVAKIKYDKHDELKQKVLDFISSNPELEVEGITSPELKHFFNSSDDEKGFFDYIDDLNFNQFLIDSASIFSEEVMGFESQDFLITDCWINKCYENGFQNPHNHCNSFISGTYYINYNSQSHSSLKFSNPLYNSVTSPYIDLNLAKYTQFNHVESVCDFVEEGFLLLWMSHLSHGYELNRKNDRITLSMNFMPSILRSGPYKFKIQK